MKETPILFKTDMVRAILQGRKTMTRRVVKPQPELKSLGGKAGELYEELTGKSAALNWSYKGTVYNPWPECFIYFNSKWKKGDLLWVKETFAQEYGGGTLYKASHSHMAPDGKWKPSLFMPKSAARMWLEITDIKVERLQDISVEDAINEGIKQLESLPLFYNYLEKRFTCTTAKQSFQSLWQSINGEDSWNANPWVWAITFKKIKKASKNKIQFPVINQEYGKK